MNENINEIIKEEIEKLPNNSKEVMTSFGWQNIIAEIAKQHLLLEDETEDLIIETLLVLIGYEDVEYYADNIESNIGTSRVEAEKLAGEITQKVFTPINNAILAKIKNSGVVQKASFSQNINFIVSGGNYSSFAEERENYEKIPENIPPIK